MLLARKGYRVLLLDKARFPSDTVSTHLIWQAGLARAKVLYGTERRNELPLESAARHWGYSPNSSATNRTVAALVAFGLLEMNDRKARLTDQ